MPVNGILPTRWNWFATVGHGWAVSATRYLLANQGGRSYQVPPYFYGPEIVASQTRSRVSNA
jgi:hypothetical protein